MSELLASISSRELTEWMAFYRIENEPDKPSPEAVAAKVKEWAMSQEENG